MCSGRPPDGGQVSNRHGLGRPAALGHCCRARRSVSARHREEAEKLRRDQESRIARTIADFKVARPPGGIDLARLYEENLIDGIVYE
jgi:hypothetical protein